jgi:hypothetical protein
MKVDKSITITIIVVATILLVTAMVLNSFAPQTETVQVQGVSEITVVPDLISINFNIETKGKNASIAKDSNSEILNKLIEELGILGISRAEIQTVNFNVYQNYDWTTGKRIENGYIATHSVKVNIDADKTDLVGKILDAGIDAGAGVSYINFELTQETQNEVKAQALELAAKDAKNKAESLASGFNKRLGSLVSISTSDWGYSPWLAYEGSGLKASSDITEVASNIQPSEQEISAYVTAVYKIR